MAVEVLIMTPKEIRHTEMYKAGFKHGTRHAKGSLVWNVFGVFCCALGFCIKMFIVGI